jgi:hypothetical protein
MKTVLQPSESVMSETRELYLHLLNLKRDDGEPATDRVLLHREVAESSELRDSHLDAAALARFILGNEVIGGGNLESLREVLDQAHRRVVDPRLTWKPRWLNAQQGIRHAHPSITNHALHHHALGS